MWVVIALYDSGNRVIGPFKCEDDALVWKREHKMSAFVRELQSPLKPH